MKLDNNIILGGFESKQSVLQKFYGTVYEIALRCNKAIAIYIALSCSNN